MSLQKSSIHIHKWKETDSLLELLVDTNKRRGQEYVQKIMEAHVIMTEKIDGSNLAIGFQINDNRVRIASRNLILSEFMLTDLNTVEYPVFNSKSLDFLQSYVMRLYELIPLMPMCHPAFEEGKWIYFIGEVYFGVYHQHGNKNWLPFGMVVEHEPNEQHKGASISYLLSHSERKLLTNAGFILPDILYEGPLTSGIVTVDEWLKTNQHEGVVINLGTTSCVKYKSPKFEEQKALNRCAEPIGVPEIDFSIQLVNNMFQAALELRRTKKVKVTKPAKVKTETPLQLAFCSLKNKHDIEDIMTHLRTHMPIPKTMSEDSRNILYESYLKELRQRVGLIEITEGIHTKLINFIKLTVTQYLANEKDI